MGLGEFILFCGIVVGIAWGGVWALGYFLPGHPGIVDKIIWGLAIIIIVAKALHATGLLSHDPQIPRLN